MNSSIASLQSQFQSLKALPQDIATSITREVLLPAGLGAPVMNYIPKGLVACLRAGATKGTIVKITKNDTVSWDDCLNSISPDQALGLSVLFQRDTGLTISTIFGDEFWNAYRSGIVKRAGVNTSSENTLKLIWACVAGDILYWRMTSQIYLDAMENETNEAKVLVLAKKGQIAFSHSEMAKNLLKSLCPCEVAITVV